MLVSTLIILVSASILSILLLLLAMEFKRVVGTKLKSLHSRAKEVGGWLGGWSWVMVSDGWMDVCTAL